MSFFDSIFFFFKQKTAYEMRISDWSSDVCSSDLARRARTISDRLRKVPGVIEAEVSAAATMRVEFKRSQTSIALIRQALAAMALSPKSSDATAAATAGGEPSPHAAAPDPRPEPDPVPEHGPAARRQDYVEGQEWTE